MLSEIDCWNPYWHVRAGISNAPETRRRHQEEEMLLTASSPARDWRISLPRATWDRAVAFLQGGPSPYRFQLLGGECFLPYSRCQTIPGALVFRRSSMDDEEHDVRSGFVFQDHLTLYSALGFFNFSQTLYGPS